MKYILIDSMFLPSYSSAITITIISSIRIAIMDILIMIIIINFLQGC